MFFTFDKWVMHEQLEQNQVLRRMPLLPCGNCILRASQELRENSRSSFCIGECMISWILSPEIYPESPNLVHMWRVMWFKHLSGAEDGHSAPLPCHGKCSEVIKTPIFAAVLRCTGDLGVPMLLSLRSSRGVTVGWSSARVSHPWEMSLLVLPRLPVRDCHSELAWLMLSLPAPEGR